MLRRICGLIAAYAVALQPLLALLAAPPAAQAGFAFELCTAGGASPGTPGEHRDPECCLLMGCGTGPALDPAPAMRGPSRVEHRVQPSAFIENFPAERPIERLRPARGPPA